MSNDLGGNAKKLWSILTMATATECRRFVQSDMKRFACWRAVTSAAPGLRLSSTVPSCAQYSEISDSPRCRRPSTITCPSHPPYRREQCRGNAKYWLRLRHRTPCFEFTRL